jgi:hypothetical protein
MQPYLHLTLLPRMSTLDRLSDATFSHVFKVFRPVTITTGLAAVLLVYLSFVRLLRFRRYRKVHEEYQQKYEAGKLTPDDAQKIMTVSSMYDMPRLLNYSLAFALYKTYGIVSRR